MRCYAGFLTRQSRFILLQWADLLNHLGKLFNISEYRFIIFKNGDNRIVMKIK